MAERYLRAGEFAAAARLSPKALRLYAEQGLLVPAAVDPATGYRGYAPEQVPRARLIGWLRRLGLPLARVARLVDLSPDVRELELRGWLRTERRRLDETEALVAATGPSDADRALTAAIARRDVPATTVLARGRHIVSAELPDLIATADRDIRAHLRASGLPDDGARRVFFEDLVTPDSGGRVEVAVACRGPVEPVDDLHVRRVAAHHAVYLPVPPSYLDLPLILRVYDLIEAWIDARPELTASGHPYELHPGTGAYFDVVYPVSA